MKPIIFILPYVILIGSLFPACAQNKETKTNISNMEQSELFQIKVGNATLFLLSEGNHAGNSSILIDATPQMMQETIPFDTFSNATNVFLIKEDSKNILIDAGYGTNLFNHLALLGILPSQIDIILLTHLHGDHIGGLLKDNTIAFPNAQLYISQLEYDYWMSDESMMKNPENRRGSFYNARAVVKAYSKQLHLFTPNDIENRNPAHLIENITAIAAYGHTPGHTLYQINNHNEKLLIWGDLTHAMAIQMPYPQVAVTYDINPQEAINSRIKVLQYVSQNKIPIAGMHIAYPAIGNIEQENTGYRFITMHK
ncbi:MAG: MBL fold metallo-hydrolase [Bacteroidales bacterium]|jgi:glyoxylase-like metal-dependent hydrolase (beta-lactamase superfamily II)|nr:MBL fold metallo-hydrolase [Bacteroidales bacterium]